MTDKDLRFAIGQRVLYRPTGQENKKATVIQASDNHIVVVFDRELEKTYLTADTWEPIALLDEDRVDYTGQRFHENSFLTIA